MTLFHIIIIFTFIFIITNICIIVILLTYCNMPKNDDNSSSSGDIVSVEQPRVDHYRVPKIPQFFRADPALWFVQVEASLRSAQISAENTKADIVIAALDFEVVSVIKDLIIQSPRPPDIFELIKKRIIVTFAASEESNLRKLLKGQVITEGKPSLILNRLRALNDGKCDNAIIKSIFLDHLPANMRAILSASDIIDVNKLADMADKIAESSASPDSVIASSTGSSEPSSSTLLEIRNDIKHLSESLKALNSKMQRLEHGCNSRKSRSQSRSDRKRTPSRERKSGKLCFWHTKYPNNPTACKQWCEKYQIWKSGK